MSRALFDQTLAVRPRNARPVSTISLSVALHAIALAAFAVLHVTASTAPLPEPPMPAFIMKANPTPPTPPAPRPVRPSTPTPAVSNLPPTEAPPAIAPEVDRPAVTGPPSLSTTIVNAGDPNAGLLGPSSRIQITTTPPAPRRPEVVHVGGDIKPPMRLVYVPPAYPSIAQSARVEGEVLLEATIDEAGVVKNVVVRHSIPLLDRAAIEAVSRWRYSPTLLNGQPVAVIMTVGVKFSLR